MATCSSADSILEAASLIKLNGTKLNTFVNGTSSQTVQLGTGSPTPTLRKFIADAQSVVATAANDAADTVLDVVADMKLNKADKFIPAEVGNLAKLSAEGNLRDAGRAAEDFVPLLTYAKGEAQELEWQVRTSMNVESVEAKAEDLEICKADKVPSAKPGNLAAFCATGILRDSGRAAEDFVPLLAYANNEAQKLMHQNRLAFDVYETVRKQYEDKSAYEHDNGIRQIAQANGLCIRNAKDLREWIGDFDESYAQHRLMQRLFDGTNPTGSSKPILFVICGQSNASGGGKYRPFERAVDCGWFWEWYSYPSPPDGAWVPLDPEDQSLKPLADPIGHGYYGAGWVPFARKFFQLTGRKVILLNIASSGSVVTDGGYTTENTWADNGYGTLRASRTVIWNAFSAAVPASSYDLGGILWHQGESDAGRIYGGRITLEDYRLGTLDVWSWLRTLIGAPTCPVFVCKIAHHMSSPSNAEQMRIWALVHKVQENFCDYETIFPGYFATEYFVKCPDLYYSDGTHYSAYGYKMLGDGIARSTSHYLQLP